MTLRPFTAWRGPPLALQIMALLLGVLVVAQVATLFLTLLLPPAPKAQYGLDDVAAMLAGGDPQTAGAGALVRTIRAGPPDITGPGWLNSEKSRVELAGLVGTTPDRVVLAFYTPLPFAGTATPRAYAMADDGFVAPFAGRASSLRPIALLQMDGAPPAMPMPMPMREMGGGGMRPPPHDGFPPGFTPGGAPGPGGAGEPGRLGGRYTPRGATAQGTPLISVETPGVGRRELIPGDGGAAVPALLRGAERAPQPIAQAPTPAGTGTADPRATLPPRAASEATLSTQVLAQQPLAPPAPAGAPPLQGFAPNAMPRLALPDRAILSAAPVPRIAPPLLVPAPQTQPLTPQARSEPLAAQPFATPSVSIPFARVEPVDAAPAPQTSAIDATPAGPPIRVASPRRSLFGLAPAPFVEGDFIAAMRLANGRWAIVQPAPEPFPNNWQRRVLLWFALSLALVTPLGWLFARRLVKPLERFAGAAESLGRDPAAIIGPLDGPAEIGRAAHAFNLMQTRLRTFVDDRTAMIGAISHDLRTPLTRMRFRIEDAPDDVRDGMLEEVDDMEAMIAEVIAFLRDASTPGTRERCDLNLLVEDVVENARMVGSDVSIESSVAAPVEVDVLGMRRLLDNLLENAVKYGDRARVRLSTDTDSAIAEVIDEGPGLPDDEIERVFEPFYRSEAARGSDKAGTGLGLAVCRSIARAHGGDVELVNAADGFRARIRVPLAYGAG